MMPLIIADQGISRAVSAHNPNPQLSGRLYAEHPLLPGDRGSPGDNVLIHAGRGGFDPGRTGPGRSPRNPCKSGYGQVFIGPVETQRASRSSRGPVGRIHIDIRA